MNPTDVRVKLIEATEKLTSSLVVAEKALVDLGINVRAEVDLGDHGRRLVFCKRDFWGLFVGQVGTGELTHILKSSPEIRLLVSYKLRELHAEILSVANYQTERICSGADIANKFAESLKSTK